ncbi:MAG: hypothetical protein AABX02_01025 [archaeon]
MKPLGIVLALLIITTLAHADAFVVDPIVEHAKPNTVIDIGGVSPGEKIELILSTDAGYGKNAEWESAILGTVSPSGGVRTQSAESGDDSLITSIQTTSITPVGTYTIPLTLSGNPDLLQNETYTIQFHVARGLIKGSLSTENVNGKVNEPSTFSVLLVNDSSTLVSLNVVPALPSVWSKPQRVQLKPHSFVTVPVIVTPRFAGPKTFDITLVRNENGLVIDTLNATLVANPTIKDRYSAGLYGFPFFTISLVANYVANAFFSFVL